MDSNFRSNIVRSKTSLPDVTTEEKVRYNGSFPHGDIGGNEVSVHRGMGNVRKEVHKGTYTHK